ncbi:hypothetical protein MSP8887_00112 [Marinomonas spartinae]|uniref:hypothetical protein n=1 Tax=Marinomonas spartinae TaxID=1792290 RepID=UPI000808A909|nr:hypothetical protein [Marinomonas spartinae]SBS25094.1 hypothetical protein MSP8887_00112 [Marinomonas spartinae]
MDKHENPVIVQKYIGPFCFLIAGIGGGYWFVSNLFSLFINFNKSVILVNQGAYYALGASIIFFSISFMVILDQWIMKPINNYWIKIGNRLIIVGFILTFSLPYIIYYYVEYSLINNGYNICESASRNWLYIHNTVYVHPPQACYKTLVYP